MIAGHCSNLETAPAAETRLISRVGTIELDGWTCRTYHVRRKEAYVDYAAISSAFNLVTSSLPDAAANDRIGVAFSVLHEGTDRLYAILCYWQNKNELITRVWILPRGSEVWTDAYQDASFCIWDMLILYAERSMFVERFLRSHRSENSGYLTSWPDPESLQRDGLLQVAPSDFSVVESIRTCRQDASWRDGPDVPSIADTRKASK